MFETKTFCSRVLIFYLNELHSGLVNVVLKNWVSIPSLCKVSVTKFPLPIRLLEILNLGWFKQSLFFASETKLRIENFNVFVDFNRGLDWDK